MTKKHLILLTGLLFGFGFGLTVQAVCPVCTVAVASGVGLSRWLGVDDLITGLWLGGLVVSLIYWTITWMDKHNISFTGKVLITSGSYYLLIFIPLYLAGIMGHPENQFLGIDKLVLGTIVGSIAFFAGAWWYEFLKKKNKGHAYFPFQKIVMPIFPLIIISLLIYFMK